MVRRVALRVGLLACALGMLPSAVAGEGEMAKCTVRQADGTLRIRRIEVREVREAQRALQRFLDHEAPGEGRRVERCIAAWQVFGSAQARAVERREPR